MAAAVRAIERGQVVTVFEAARDLGGRARALDARLPDGRAVRIDNGQHLLIGAYTETLRLMRLVGVDLDAALLRLPLRLQFPDGRGLRLPDWPAPMDALAGILRARGWSWGERWSLMRCALGWRLAGFTCAADVSVADLCDRLPATVRNELIAPLCVSALNVPAEQASGQVFLRVLRDALFGERGASHMLLPRVDLAALFPDAAARWLARQGAQVHPGVRAQVQPAPGGGWAVAGTPFDAVVLATPASEALRQVRAMGEGLDPAAGQSASRWCDTAKALDHTAITTVYAWGAGARLPAPILALRSDDHGEPPLPAQFVVDRGQTGGPEGLLAFVISASTGEREATERQTLAQARVQLGLELQPVQTVVEKRATFACRPGVQRPGPDIAPGLRACGDYIDGPYPATLEAAVRSGIAVIP